MEALQNEVLGQIDLVSVFVWDPLGLLSHEYQVLVARESEHVKTKFGLTRCCWTLESLEFLSLN